MKGANKHTHFTLHRRVCSLVVWLYINCYKYYDGRSLNDSFGMSQRIMCRVRRLKPERLFQLKSPSPTQCLIVVSDDRGKESSLVIFTGISKAVDNKQSNTFLQSFDLLSVSNYIYNPRDFKFRAQHPSVCQSRRRKIYV